VFLRFPGRRRAMAKRRARKWIAGAIKRLRGKKKG